MVTIKQIAAACNLSPAQVSRALNGYADVSVSTRQLVMETARQLGYVKNLLAAGLVNRTSNQVAVIIEGMEVDTNEAISGNIFRLLQGISFVAAELSYEPLIYLKNRFNHIDYVDFVRQRYASGVIVFGSHYDNPQLTMLRQAEFPCVTVDIMAEGPSNGCVVVNNVYYAQAAVSHLIEKGCKKIAVLCGFQHSYVTFERRSGYQLALHAHQMVEDESIIVYADFSADKARQATLELMGLHEDIDGFFCMNDQMALGCLEALKSLGKLVPQDVRIFGFDGMFFTALTTPTLSTIEQDFYQKGIAAMKLLANILKGENHERTIVVPCRVLLRQSTE